MAFQPLNVYLYQPQSILLQHQNQQVSQDPGIIVHVKCYNRKYPKSEETVI